MPLLLLLKAVVMLTQRKVTMSREREGRRRILRMKTTKTMTNQLMKMTKSRLFMF